MTEINLTKNGRTIIALICVLAALVSFIFGGRFLSAPETYGRIYSSLDEKVETVLKLTATATVASTAVSALPSDIGTPIADEIADYTQYFVLIVCLLLAEKYALTLVGGAVCRIMIPLGFLCLILMLFGIKKQLLRHLALKIFALSAALILVIPTSVALSDKVYETGRASVEETISIADEFTSTTIDTSRAEGNSSLFDSIRDYLSETTSGIVNKASEMIKRFVKTIGLFLVTSCVIPVLVLLFFVWLVKLLTGLEIPLHYPRRRAEREESKDPGT